MPPYALRSLEPVAAEADDIRPYGYHTTNTRPCQFAKSSRSGDRELLTGYSVW